MFLIGFYFDIRANKVSNVLPKFSKSQFIFTLIVENKEKEIRNKPQTEKFSFVCQISQPAKSSQKYLYKCILYLLKVYCIWNDADPNLVEL